MEGDYSSLGCLPVRRASLRDTQGPLAATIAEAGSTRARPIAGQEPARESAVDHLAALGRGCQGCGEQDGVDVGGGSRAKPQKIASVPAYETARLPAPGVRRTSDRAGLW